MINVYEHNRVNGKSTWHYETLVHNASIIEDIIYRIALYKKAHNKLCYVSICGFDGKAVAGARVQDINLYTIGGRGCVGGIVLYNRAYKIKFSSFNTVSLIPVER